MKLYHFTCTDMAAQIGGDGHLRPHPQAHVPADLLWLTDLTQPYREALGLTPMARDRDRCAVRYEVDTDAATPWIEWARAHLPGHDNWTRVNELNNAFGALPRHWWVATEPIAVTTRSDTEGGH
jgi:hypothetical protein